MNSFTQHNDAMYIAAKEILEGLSDITDKIAKFKKGDKTNFGVVTDIGQNSISFKAKDLPVTKIPFNQRKMGSKDFVLDKLTLMEDEELEEAFRPGDGMVPAPIGKDTVTSKGLKKLWGIKMRAGKWADTFIGLFDLPDGKAYGIIDAEGTTRYASMNDFNAAFKKLQLQTEEIEIEESSEIDMNKFKMLAKLGLLRDGEVNLVVSGIKKMQAGEGLVSVVQTKVMAEAFVKLVSIVTGDLTLLAKVRAALGEDVKLEEGFGTATITAPDNKLNGKQVSIFHKFDDGRLNVQYVKSNKKGDVINLTLKKGQYKLD